MNTLPAVVQQDVASLSSKEQKACVERMMDAMLVDQLSNEITRDLTPQRVRHYILHKYGRAAAQQHLRQNPTQKVMNIALGSRQAVIRLAKNQLQDGDIAAIKYQTVAEAKVLRIGSTTLNTPEIADKCTLIVVIDSIFPFKAMGFDSDQMCQHAK